MFNDRIRVHVQCCVPQPRARHRIRYHQKSVHQPPKTSPPQAPSISSLKPRTANHIEMFSKLSTFSCTVHPSFANSTCRVISLSPVMLYTSIDPFYITLQSTFMNILRTNTKQQKKTTKSRHACWQPKSAVSAFAMIITPKSEYLFFKPHH